MAGNADFRDLFQCLNDAGVRFLVVGAYAVMYHTEPRYTKGLDVWVEPTPENAERVWKALAEFGAPVSELTVANLQDPELVYQVGIEPNRFDILMAVAGLTFEEAWTNRVSTTYADQTIGILCLDDILRAKTTSARPQDIFDATRLEAAKRRR
jgi:hypothetical protein